MIRFIYLCSVFLCLFANAKAQDMGLYAQSGDFETRRFTVSLPYQKGYKMILKGFSWDKMLLKSPTDQKLFNLSEYWGYYSPNYGTVRYWQNDHYKIVYQQKAIVIYRFCNGKTITYHFSKSLNDPILRLNKKNLAKIYADQPSVFEIVKSWNNEKDWSKHPNLPTQTLDKK